MMLGKSRKQKAKEKYLNRNKSVKKTFEKQGLSVDQLSDTMLPDDFEFDGVKVFNGKTYKTAGAYKKAVKKAQYNDYTPGDQP